MSGILGNLNCCTGVRNNYSESDSTRFGSSRTRNRINNNNLQRDLVRWKVYSSVDGFADFNRWSDDNISDIVRSIDNNRHFYNSVATTTPRHRGTARPSLPMTDSEFQDWTFMDDSSLSASTTTDDDDQMSVDATTISSPEEFLDPEICGSRVSVASSSSQSGRVDVARDRFDPGDYEQRLDYVLENNSYCDKMSRCCSTLNLENSMASYDRSVNTWTTFALISSDENFNDSDDESDEMPDSSTQSMIESYFE